MENIRLTINKGKYTESYGGNIDLRPAYPLEYAIFKHNISGLYAQYVDHITISGFALNWGDGLPSFFTHGVEINHFNDLLLDDIKADPAPSSRGLPAIKLSYGQNAELRNCITRKGTELLKKEMVK
jgi:hypothetical protein